MGPRQSVGYTHRGLTCTSPCESCSPFRPRLTPFCSVISLDLQAQLRRQSLGTMVPLELCTLQLGLLRMEGSTPGVEGARV